MRQDGGKDGVPHCYGCADDSKQHMEEEEEEDEGDPKSSICCLQGCLAATAVGFSFFVALPTGILLVIYASNKNDIPLLSVGAVLVSLPLLMLIVVIVLCFNQRRLARLRKSKVTVTSREKSSTATTTMRGTSVKTTTNSTSVMDSENERYQVEIASMFQTLTSPKTECGYLSGGK